MVPQPLGYIPPSDPFQLNPFCSQSEEDVLCCLSKASESNTEALQMAALTQTLASIKKLKSKEMSGKDSLFHKKTLE